MCMYVCIFFYLKSSIPYYTIFTKFSMYILRHSRKKYCVDPYPQSPPLNRSPSNFLCTNSIIFSNFEGEYFTR